MRALVKTAPGAGNVAVLDVDVPALRQGDALVRILRSGLCGTDLLVDDGTYRANYFGLDRTNVPAYSSYVTASTGALSVDLMQRVSDILDQKDG